MRRVYIVVEGQTEQEFVNTVISPYLQGFGVFSITPVLIRTSRNGRGGMVNYQHVSILFSALTRMFPKPTFAP